LADLDVTGQTWEAEMKMSDPSCVARILQYFNKKHSREMFKSIR